MPLEAFYQEHRPLRRPGRPPSKATAALAHFRNLVGQQWSRSEKLPGVGYLLTVSATRQK
jgi:hypothetical protein